MSEKRGAPRREPRSSPIPKTRGECVANDTASEQAVQEPVDNSLGKKPSADERGNEVATDEETFHLQGPPTWQGIIAGDPTLRSHEKHVALTLPFYWSEMSQTAAVGPAELTRTTSLGLTSVKKALRGLVIHGYLKKDSGGPT